MGWVTRCALPKYGKPKYGKPKYGKDAEGGLSSAVVFSIRISRCREVTDRAYFWGVLFQ